MKKKIIGVSFFIALTTIVTINAHFDENAKYGVLLANIEAFASDSESSKTECTGPKSDVSPYSCRSENTNPCSDTVGCD